MMALKHSSRRYALMACASLLLWPPGLVWPLQGTKPPAPETGWEALAREALLRGELDVARQQAERGLPDPSTAPVAHELLGQIAFREKRNQEAVSHFQAARDRGRLTLAMMRDWSAALLTSERHSEARELLERALSQDASQTDLRYRLAASYSAEGRWKEAWPHWEEVYRQGWRHAGVVMQLARARFAAGEDLQAVKLLQNLAATSSTTDSLWEAGKLLFEKALYRQALPPLQKAWQQRPGSYDIGMYLALSHYLIEQYAESEAVLAQIDAGSDRPSDFCILLGSVYARLGKWEAARKELEEATRRFPQRVDGYLNFGLFCLERGDTEQAIGLFAKASRLPSKGAKLLYTLRSRKTCEGLRPPVNVSTRDDARGQLCSQLAEQLDARQQSDAALELFRLALEADPGSERAYAGLGKICREKDSVSEARAFLEKGLSLHPNSATLHFNLGLVFQSLGEPGEAVRRFQKAIELRGAEAPALDWIQLGTAQQSSGNAKDAERSFLKGLNLDPTLAQGHFELGKLYFQQASYDRAEQFLEKAIQLDSRLLGAYYQYGLACLRNGKTEKGNSLLKAFHEKKELYAPPVSSMLSPGPAQP